jgi:hypothetical protein
VENREKQSTITHNPQDNTNIFYGKPLREKNQLEGEPTLLSFLWYKNNASIKEKVISIELIEICGMLGFYRTLNPSIMLSNFPLPISLLRYGRQYNNIESNPFS